MDPGDNGVYVIRGWEIVDRVYPYEPFEEEREYPLGEMLGAIDASQPEGQRLGAYLDAEEVPVSEVVPATRCSCGGSTGASRRTPWPASATAAL